MNKNSDIYKLVYAIMFSSQNIYLLISLSLLVDVYLINIFNFGLMDINISVLLNVNNIKHIIFFSIIFGVTFCQISRLTREILIKIFARWLYKPCNNSINYLELKKQAIDNGDVFLMDYVRDETKNMIRIKINYQVIYTLLISIIIDSFKNNSVLGKVLEIFYFNNSNVVKICLGLIVFVIISTVIISVYCSIAFDEEKIYYKK